jgi:hypothetical protein
MDSDRFDAAVYARRLAAAAAATADAGLAGLVITPGYDLRYLIGSRAQTFERLTALVLPASGDPTVVLPRMELASLKGSAVAELGLAVRDWVDGDDPYQLVGAALGGASVATAVTDSMPALHLLPLAGVLGVLPVLATDVLRTLRMVKDECEIDALRKAAAAINRACECRLLLRAVPRPTSPPASPAIVAKGIRMWRSSSSAPARTAPTRTTVIRIVNCKSVTSSSSTSGERTSPDTTRTRPGPTASVSPDPMSHSSIRCCNGPSARRLTRCVRV